MGKAPIATRKITPKMLGSLKGKTEKVNSKTALTKEQIKKLGEQARNSFNFKLNNFEKYGNRSRYETLKDYSHDLKKLSARLKADKAAFEIETDYNRKSKLYEDIKTRTNEIISGKRLIRLELLTGKLEILTRILLEEGVVSKLPEKIWEDLDSLRGIYTKQAEFDFRHGKSRLIKMEELDSLCIDSLKKINSIKGTDSISTTLRELEAFLSNKRIELKKEYPEIDY